MGIVSMGVYNPHMSLYPHTSIGSSISPCTSVCSPYTMFSIWHGDFRGYLYNPYVLGTFGWHQYICQAFLCLSVYPFAFQFIKVMPFAPHHCGLHLYWAGWLWMSAMLHAVVPFFVAFSLCLKFLLPQL